MSKSKFSRSGMYAVAGFWFFIAGLLWWPEFLFAVIGLVVFLALSGLIYCAFEDGL